MEREDEKKVEYLHRYGASHLRISKEIKISKEKAKKLIKKYNEAYGGR